MSAHWTGLSATLVKLIAGLCLRAYGPGAPVPSGPPPPEAPVKQVPGSSWAYSRQDRPAAVSWLKRLPRLRWYSPSAVTPGDRARDEGHVVRLRRVAGGVVVRGQAVLRDQAVEVRRLGVAQERAVLLVLEHDQPDVRTSAGHAATRTRARARAQRRRGERRNSDPRRGRNARKAGRAAAQPESAGDHEDGCADREPSETTSPVPGSVGAMHASSIPGACFQKGGGLAVKSTPSRVVVPGRLPLFDGHRELKAGIAAAGVEPPRTHDLDWLARRQSAFGLPISIDDLLALVDAHVQGRYPDDPASSYGPEEASTLIDVAASVVATAALSGSSSPALRRTSDKVSYVVFGRPQSGRSV